MSLLRNLAFLKLLLPKSLKIFLRSLRDTVTSMFCRPLSHNVQKRLLIIRTDAIGDYLLFRPFIQTIRDTYQNYHITLLGNQTYKDLAYQLDSVNIDSFLWLSLAKFNHNLFYRIYFLRKLKKLHFSIALHPVFSRDYIAQTLISYINADEKIAPLGDIINTTKEAKIKADRFYTTLTQCAPEIMFEFYRNAEFFSQVLKPYTPPSPFIKLEALPKLKSIPPSPYSVLFIGASSAYRKWNIKHFNVVGLHLMQKHRHNIVICGGKEDVSNAVALESSLQAANTNSIHKPMIMNLVGKTSLTELGSLVYNGNLLISNETSCAHLGALLYTTIVIVVYNGNHLGRFIPYPKEISDKYYPVFHPFIEDNPHRYTELSNAYAYKSELNINEITPDRVIALIDSILQKRSNNG